MKKLSLLFIIISVNTVASGYEVDSTMVQQLGGLCRVWGFLKYYHPQIQEGKVDWDSELLLIVPKILAVSNNEDYNKIINQLIQSAGSIKKLSRPYQYLPKDTSYNNFDYSWISDKKLFTKENSRMLWEVIENYKPNDNVYFKKEFNTRVDENKFRDNPNENNYYPDTAHSLLALFRYWNVINYFYPYKKLMDENWNDVLIEFIPKTIENAGTGNFYLTIAELVAELNDCHSFFDNYYFNHHVGPLKSLYDWRNVPLLVMFIENKTIITRVRKRVADQTNLKRSDIILAINGTPIDEIRNELRKYCGCSTSLSVEREISNGIFMSYFAPRENNYSITISDSANTIRTVTISNETAKGAFVSLGVLDSITRLISDSIGYINLSSMNRKDIRRAIKHFQNTSALIFDLRDNSNASLLPIGMRLPRRKGGVFANYYACKFKYPGSFKFSKQKDMYLGLRTFHKKYKGNVIFLINENVQSTYEWQLMSLQSDYRITLIGNNTSGTDGASPSFLIQNNILTFFSGDGVFYPDGKQVQRIGIKPDICAVQTIKGIREGRDDVLDRAVKFIQTGK